VTKKDERFMRGFGFQGGARRLGWQQGANGAGVGADLSPPGLLIHEMGTARMGRDPRTSVLNQHNQAHDVPNLFVIDGAAMTSSACQLRGDC
jgi:choline dehydrogenase-like flavoprotein